MQRRKIYYERITLTFRADEREKAFGKVKTIGGSVVYSGPVIKRESTGLVYDRYKIVIEHRVTRKELSCRTT